MTTHNKPDSEMVSDTLTRYKLNRASDSPNDFRRLAEEDEAGIWVKYDDVCQLERKLNEANKKLATACNDALEEAAELLELSAADKSHEGLYHEARHLEHLAKLVRAIKSNSYGSGE
jgi:hypothetical protein